MSRISRPSNPRVDARTVALFQTGEEKRQLEARNAILQFDEVCRMVQEDGQFRISPEILRRLQCLAISELYVCAGHFRNNSVHIHGSIHTPPEHKLVASFVEEMCDRANSETDWPPIRTAAYLMWRLNWIHPFFGGNGRTSRVVSYYALCSRIGTLLPGPLTIPEQIMRNRSGYYDALDLADMANREGRLDLSMMESLLKQLMARQLLSHPDAAQQVELMDEFVRLATTPPSRW